MATRIYHDIGHGFLTSERAGSKPLTRLDFRAGDSRAIEVEFFRYGIAYVPTTVEELVFVIKAGTRESNPALAVVLTGDWAEDTGIYTGTLTLGPDIRTALGTETGITLKGELTATLDGIGPNTSRKVAVQMDNDLWKGDEVPPAATPTLDDYIAARAVLYDRAQTLTEPQKTQARENIGAGTGGGGGGGTVDVVSNVATATILGRITAGSGNSEELSATQVRTLINVENGADVTDTANVTAAGALMDSEVTNLAQVKAFSSADYATAAQGTDERVPTAAGLTSKFGTNKITIVDADKVAILDSAASDAPKHSLFSLVKSTLKTYFDTLYAAISHAHISDNITDATSDGINNPERILLADTNSRIALGGLELGHLTDTTITRASAGVIAVEGVSVSMAGHTHTAANITDFSSAVAATAAVTANTAKVSNATHTGDATGSGALSVVRIQGVDIPAPGAGDNLKYIRYNHSTGDFDYSAPAGSGDALTSATLDQFADVSQTPGATLTIPANATISGTNTGDNAVNSLYSSLVSNANHTGDVTGSTVLALDKTAITGKTAVTAVGTDYVLISDTSDSGNIKKALVSDFLGGGGGGGGDMLAANNLSELTDLTDARINLGVNPASPITLSVTSAYAVEGRVLTAVNTGTYSYTGVRALSIGKGVTSIGADAFRNCPNLTSIVFPDELTSIGSTAFLLCPLITEVILPNSVTTLSTNAFRNMAALTSLLIPESVTSMGFGITQDSPSLTTIKCRCPLTSIGATSFAYTFITAVRAKASDASWTAGAGQTIGGKSGITVTKDL